MGQALATVLRPHGGSGSDADLCKRYIVRRQETGVADSTINRTPAVLKRMFHLATECTPPKVQFLPCISMLQENNVRTGFVETEARLRLERACGRIGLWMSALAAWISPQDAGEASRC